MKVTIKDVANEAKVATSTVSRVLSKKSRISEETKKRVLDAIKKLNYTPNVVAQGLANRSTKVLALVLPEESDNFFTNPFYSYAMKGISNYAKEENYYIMYAFVEENDDSWLKRFTNSNLVDGIFLFNARENDVNMRYLQDIDFPFVIIGRPKDVKNTLWVDNDNFGAMYNVTKKIASLGHKKIGFIGSNFNLNYAKDRLEGYKEGLYSMGLEFKEDYIIEMDSISEEAGYNAAEILSKYDELTAIIAIDDLIAIGVQKYLLKNNKDKIAHVGFNNIPLAKYQKIPLASIDVNAEALGIYATKLLINKLEKKEEDENYYIIDTKFIDRESLYIM